MNEVVQQLLALKSASSPELRMQWKSLFGTEAPHYNRRFLENRLAYRIQELAYGGLKPQSQKRLAALAGGGPEVGSNTQSKSDRHRPVNGTRLIRDYRGRDYQVTVREDHFEFDGRRYKSLSAIAYAITATRWNGWAFFGLKGPRVSS